MTRAPFAGIGFRLRLFLVSIALMTGVGAVSTGWLHSSLQGLVEQRIEDELAWRVHAARVLVEATDPAPDITAIDPLVDALGADSRTRVTVVAADGRVLGDSWLDQAAVQQIENHRQRPEVRAALETGQLSTSTRHSDTIGADMMYVAEPCDIAGHRGVVRVAMELSTVALLERAFNLSLAAAALAGLVFAIFMSGLASYFASHDLLSMLALIRVALVRSSPGQPAPKDPPAVAGGVVALADRLQQAVGDIADERARLQALLASMGEAVLALDASLRVTLANPAAVTLLELTQSPEGRLLIDLVRTPVLVDAARSVLQGAGDVQAELHLPDGRTLLAAARTLPRDAGCVLVLRDVSEIRHLERVRRDFVANVSHELRTPVSIIAANAESLADGALEEPAVAKAFVHAIQRNAQRMGAVINDLLQISRIEAGRLSLDLVPVAVGPVARSAREGVIAKAVAAGQELTLDLPPDLVVVGDEMALEHVLLNLLENAVKYTPRGGSIRVTATAVGKAGAGSDRVRISVVDDGPGIPERHRARVFERFYRVDPGRSRDAGGTGLGLAIVRHLAEHMDGQVGVDPVQPRGSSFWIELPGAS